MSPKKFYYVLTVLTLSQLPTFTNSFHKIPLGHNENLPQDMKPGTKLKKCYDLLGCFNIDPLSTGLARHCGFPPHPNVNKIIIYFYSQSTNETLIYRYPNIKLDKICFNPREDTYVIIPGSNSFPFSDWVFNVRKYLTQSKNYNILVVDWVTLAYPLNNLIICGLARTISSEIAAVLLTMNRKLHLDIEKTHCIGHSAGVEICSFLGKNTSGLMSSIAGIDASSVFFEGFPADIQPSKTDAQFVMGLHVTSAPLIPFLAVGYIRPYGHVDFYFNGGFIQPKCVLDALKLQLWMPPECPHDLAPHYFFEAIAGGNCTFWGRKKSVKEYVKGNLNGITGGLVVERFTPTDECVESGDCLPLGLDTGMYPGRGVYYINTRAKPPFCYGDDGYLNEAYDYYDKNYQNLGIP